MKKLYIPTTTFNFNNILSSESVSPKAYYERRGFGYKRWMEIPENNIDNAILLYDDAFAFERPASDIEDHPMLIEIETDKDYPKLEEGVYYSDKTIYLSPWNTRFVFFCEKDRMVALSLSDSSLETKMLPIYRNKLVVETIILKTSPVNINACIPLCEEGIELDFRINKMKGLLYGYYIGAQLSSNQEIVRKYNSLQDLYNIFSSILSSENHVPTITQSERMDFLISDVQKDIPCVKFLNEKLDDTQNIFDVIDQLEMLGVRFPGYVRKKHLVDSVVNGLLEDNFAINWVKDKLSQLKQQEEKVRVRLSASSEEIIVTDLGLSKIANLTQQEEALVKVWINYILSQNEYIGHIGTYKEELSDAITLTTREKMQSDWENSSIRQQLNSMRKYVRGQDVDFVWSNDIVSAMTAVLAKSNDWEQLYSFMKSKYISDYRIAFAFYGELIGFANLTRDFTDYLLASSDRNYVADVYKEFMGQLLGIEPVMSISSKEEPSSIIKDTERKDCAIQNEDFSKVDDEFEQLINSITLVCKSASKDKRLYEKHYKEHGLTDAFFVAIKNDKHFGRGKGVQKTVMKELGRMLKASKSKGQTVRKQSVNEQQAILFDLDIIHKMRCFAGLSEVAKKRLLDNWNYTVKEKGYMTKDQINYFVRLCKKEGDGRARHKELFGIFTEVLANEFIKEIKEH